MTPALVLCAEGDAPPRITSPFKVRGRSISLGRAPSNDVTLDVPHVSSRHAVIHHVDGQYVLTDLGSTNGSVVERHGQRLILGSTGTSEVKLQDGDLLLLGDIDHPVQLRVAFEAGASLERLSSTVVAHRTVPQAQLIAARGGAPLAQALLRLVEAFNTSSEREPILEHVARAALELIPGAADALVVERGDGDALKVAAGAHQGAGISATPDATICTQVLEEGTAALLFGQHDAAVLPAATLVGQGLGSGIAAAIGGSADSGPAGVLQINCAPGCHTLSELHLDLAVVLAHHATLAIERADLLAQLQAAHQRLKEENALLRRRAHPRLDLVAESPAMRAVLEELRQAAATDVTVLLLGETGSGKEVAARFLHQESRRCHGLLVPVNCGALTESLLDSELFGHRKGAFTGATSDRKGVFEVAAGGTVFLDEIGETPAAVQVRLLRVLEESKIKPVGEAIERKVDVRIVAATNRDLAALVEEGRFRRDLYYRLKVFPVTLPPLRDRPEDLAPLCELFAQRAAQRLAKAVGPVDPSFVAALSNHRFPGNIRELSNEVERAVVRVPIGEPLTARLLSLEVQGGTVEPELSTEETLSTQLARLEREIIARTLRRHQGRKAATAEALGLTRQGLAKKMARLGL